MRTRDEAWRALDKNFKSFMDCLGQLTEEELTSTAVEGNWTVKDVMAHVWTWVDEAVATVKAWDGPRTWQQGIAFDDNWNEAETAKKSALHLISVVDGITGAHRRLMHLLDLATDEELASVASVPWGDEMPMVDFFWEVAEHYRAHAERLRVYEEGCLNCD